MIGFLAAVAAHWQAAQVRRVTTRELAAMSMRELGDMHITRLDISRLFEPGLASEFRSRGAPVASLPRGRSNRRRKDRQP